VLGVRLAAAWLAGINRMRWSTFAFWTALGGVAWATTVGLAADLLGPIAEQVFRAVGVVGVAVGAAAALAYVAWLRSRARSNGLPVPGSEPSA
jgi:membrane protein DedA with SNARE-associated domain